MHRAQSRTKQIETGRHTHCAEQGNDASPKQRAGGARAHETVVVEVGLCGLVSCGIILVLLVSIFALFLFFPLWLMRVKDASQSKMGADQVKVRTLTNRAENTLSPHLSHQRLHPKRYELLGFPVCYSRALHSGM